MKQIRNRHTGEIMCEGLSLKDVLDKHKKWLNGEEGGERARLVDAYMEGADLEGADLEDTDLEGANLEGANLDYEIQEGLLERIAEIVLEDNEKLNMRNWHTCETTHCIAGWACHLNDKARELEKTHGTQIAGLLTLGQEAHSMFFKSKDDVLIWLKEIK